MKKSIYSMLCVTLLASLVFVDGCKKDVVTPEDTTVPNDVFPLTANNRFEYSGYFTNADTEIPLTGTNAFYNSSWTIGSAVTPLSAVFGTTYAGIISAANGGRTSATLVRDSTLTAPGGARKFTPVFAYYDSTNNDYYYMSNLGLFFRSSRIKDPADTSKIRIDSLRFIKLASPKVGIGAEFTSFEGDFVSYSNPLALTTINLKITGKWESKTDVTVNGQTFSTYYLVISRVAKVGPTVVSSGVTARLWLAKGIGPVKMLLIGDAETPGNYRELKSKNF